MEEDYGGVLAEGRGRHEKTGRAMKETWGEEIDDREIETNDRFTRPEGLAYAALRVWELKHGFGD